MEYNFEKNLQNDKYDIEIGIDSAYSIGSSDNARCDILINAKGYCQSDRYKALRISVIGTRDTEIVVIADEHFACGIYALLDEDTLAISYNRCVAVIDIASGAFVCRELDISGEIYSLHMLGSSYIVHSELDILKIDGELKTVWSFSGEDAFVSRSEKSSFEISDGRIRLTDFSDNFYELDMNGDLIK